MKKRDWGSGNCTEKQLKRLSDEVEYGRQCGEAELEVHYVGSGVGESGEQAGVVGRGGEI